VFLDSDNNVKLGDFGLSKIIQSHDFASTYVGTPYYMSPEVCGAERYSTASDIWSLGCLIYELCTWSPPFNARSHVELFTKIKNGRYSPLPPVYSSELSKVVSSCLQVNPNTRPDTSRLLGLPMVSVMRKQIEAVQTHKALKTEIDVLRKKEAELQKREEEMNAKLQMEWEVRAQLEINKYVDAEKARLEAIFEDEVSKRVAVKIQTLDADGSRRSSGEQSLGGKTMIDGGSSGGDSQKSQGASIVASDLGVGRLTLESPATNKTTTGSLHNNLASVMAQHERPAGSRRGRAPFMRAQTTVAPVMSPMDVTMGEPSPMSIASLSLSPRKDNVGNVTHTQRRVSGNIFATRRTSNRWQPTPASPTGSEYGDDMAASFGADDENEILTRSPSHRDPAKRNKRISMVPGREGLATKRLASAPSLVSGVPAPISANNGSKRPLSAVPVVSTSPSRQNKVNVLESPSRNGGRTTKEGGSPVRKLVSTFRSKRGAIDAEAAGMVRSAVRGTQQQPNGVTGRTLVELAQARAGGVDRSGQYGSNGNLLSGNMLSTKGAAVSLQEMTEPAIWNPERDEMPSPFLARGKTVIRAFR
jgi:hypothetical protein